MIFCALQNIHPSLLLFCGGLLPLCLRLERTLPPEIRQEEKRDLGLSSEDIVLCLDVESQYMCDIKQVGEFQSYTQVN